MTVGTLMNNLEAACWLVSPSATTRATSASVGVRAAQPAAGRVRSPRERRGMTWIYLLGAVAVLIVLLVVGLVVLAAPSDEDRHPSS